MKRASILLALSLFGALPLAAQSTEFGVLIGGSRRFVENGARENSVSFLDSSFSFSNSAVDLYWGMKIDDETLFKIKAGRIETEVAEAYNIPGTTIDFRRDHEGEVQHVDAVVEYRFSEPYGSTGIFAGLGLYRHVADEMETRQSFGWSAGVTSDFPISRRYGIALEAAYHWTRGDFRPRYLTVSGGLRVAF